MIYSLQDTGITVIEVLLGESQRHSRTANLLTVRFSAISQVGPYLKCTNICINPEKCNFLKSQKVAIFGKFLIFELGL